MFGTGRGTGVGVRLFGTPVRLEWSFILVVGVIGAQFVPRPLLSKVGIGYLTLWIVLVTFGVLIHEAGHVAALRAFGARSRVVMAWVGGATIPESRKSLTGVPSIVVSLAGPAAGMTLAFIVDAAIGDPASRLELWLRHYSWFVNFWWSIFNLIPVLPLDGGHVIRELLEMSSKRHGRNIAAGFSITVVVAATWWIHSRGFGTIVLFGVAAVLIGINVGFMTVTHKQRRRRDLDEAHQQILDGELRAGTDIILGALGTPDDELVSTEAYTVAGWALLDEGRLGELAWLSPERFHPAHRPLLEGAVAWQRGDVVSACHLVAAGLGNGSVDPPPTYFRRTFGRLGELDALARSVDALPAEQRSIAFTRLRASLSVAPG